MENPYEKPERLSRIFLPTANDRIDALSKGNGKLAHYTTAENALKILKNKEIWLRNARSMQDYSELHHGLNQLSSFFADQQLREKFDAAFTDIAENILQEAMNIFGNRWDQLQANTYLSCFSQHFPNENSRGRLSMWRAFGKDVASVALVINCPEKYSALPLNAFMFPVMYYSDTSRLKDEMEKVIKCIQDNKDFLKTIDRQEIVNWLYTMLHFGAVTIKHPSFDEEKEWRLCHFPTHTPSVHVPAEIEVLNGIPQIVHKVRLINKPAMGISKIEITELLDRVIIGPSQYNKQIEQAFLNELAALGFSEPYRKVFVSDIPIRA